MTKENKDIAVVLPSWNPNEPRFVVEECPRCSDDRVFKNDKCVYNQRLGFAYSVNELVEVLNSSGESWDKVNDFIRDTYLKLKHDDTEQVYSRDSLLDLFKSIADEVEIDLKEYPRISLDDLIKKEKDG